MNIIDIKPVAVALNVTANKVAFQVLTLDLTPKTFNLNARFFSDKVEVSNVPFELPISDYNDWKSDLELENKCLTALNLERLPNAE